MNQSQSPSIEDDDVDYAYYESLQQSAKDGILAHPYDYYEMGDGDYEDHCLKQAREAVPEFN